MSDLIDRQAAIDAMDCISDSICGQQAVDALCDLPSAERKGKWLYTDDLFETPFCSECKVISYDYFKFNYCPNCGARMVEE